jgi:hypothetical protein
MDGGPNAEHRKREPPPKNLIFHCVTRRYSQPTLYSNLCQAKGFQSRIDCHGKPQPQW